MKPMVPVVGDAIVWIGPCGNLVGSVQSRIANADASSIPLPAVGMFGSASSKSLGGVHIAGGGTCHLGWRVLASPTVVHQPVCLRIAAGWTRLGK